MFFEVAVIFSTLQVVTMIIVWWKYDETIVIKMYTDQCCQIIISIIYCSVVKMVNFYVLIMLMIRLLYYYNIITNISDTFCSK
jgi:hypothetical protein